MEKVRNLFVQQERLWWTVNSEGARTCAVCSRCSNSAWLPRSSSFCLCSLIQVWTLSVWALKASKFLSEAASSSACLTAASAAWMTSHHCSSVFLTALEMFSFNPFLSHRFWDCSFRSWSLVSPEDLELRTVWIEKIEVFIYFKFLCT